MSEPTYDDLMQVVDKQNRFAVAPDGQEETTQRLKELKAFKGKEAIQTLTNVKQWKKGGYGFIEDLKPDQQCYDQLWRTIEETQTCDIMALAETVQRHKQAEVRDSPHGIFSPWA